jgi:hypothetical protein
MTERTKPKTRAKRKNFRRFEADTDGLLSLRLIAAPDPKDDMSDAELKDLCGDPRHSPELIRLLIDTVKSL